MNLLIPRRFASIICCIGFLLVFSSLLFSQNSALIGLWENKERFVEITDDYFRIILKPYFGFVWEDTGEIPSEILKKSNNEWVVLLNYTASKIPYKLTLANINEALYLNFFVKVNNIEREGDYAKSENILDGFYLSNSTSSSILIYPEVKKDEFFAYYFEDEKYAKIRYWKQDLKVQDIKAEFSISEKYLVKIPKFVILDEDIYTCITSTGKILRNYEVGTYKITNEGLVFNTEKIVYPGTNALYYKAIPFKISEDGNVFVLGEAYLTKSKIANIDSEIEIHNGKRRPLRKPVFGYMELDFLWDEIEKIRKKR